jgi:hypothetical protein
MADEGIEEADDAGALVVHEGAAIACVTGVRVDGVDGVDGVDNAGADRPAPDVLGPAGAGASMRRIAAVLASPKEEAAGGKDAMGGDGLPTVVPVAIRDSFRWFADILLQCLSAVASLSLGAPILGAQPRILDAIRSKSSEDALKA